MNSTLPNLKDIEAALEPTHTHPEGYEPIKPVGLPSSKELKAEAAATVTTDDIVAPDPREFERYTFNFSWTDGRGRVWSGEFTNRILTMAEREEVGVMRVRLQAGYPLESFDALTVNLNLSIAHMLTSLDSKRPKWSEDIRLIKDIMLVQALYEEVASHETIFFGYKKVEAAS